RLRSRFRFLFRFSLLDLGLGQQTIDLLSRQLRKEIVRAAYRRGGHLGWIGQVNSLAHHDSFHSGRHGGAHPRALPAPLSDESGGIITLKIAGRNAKLPVGLLSL